MALNLVIFTLQNFTDRAPEGIGGRGERAGMRRVVKARVERGAEGMPCWGERKCRFSKGTRSMRLFAATMGGAECTRVHDALGSTLCTRT